MLESLRTELIAGSGRPGLRVEIAELDVDQDETVAPVLHALFEQLGGVDIVDALHGAVQTVIKPMGPLFQHIEGVGGATILGTGDVGFILDIGQLVRKVAAPRARAKEAVC